MFDHQRIWCASGFSMMIIIICFRVVGSSLSSGSCSLLQISSSSSSSSGGSIAALPRLLGACAHIPSVCLSPNAAAGSAGKGYYLHQYMYSIIPCIVCTLCGPIVAIAQTLDQPIFMSMIDIVYPTHARSPHQVGWIKSSFWERP